MWNDIAKSKNWKEFFSIGLANILAQITSNILEDEKSESVS